MTGVKTDIALSVRGVADQPNPHSLNPAHPPDPVILFQSLKRLQF